MKFSYSLIKKLVPDVGSKKELVKLLSLHSLEAEDAGIGVLDVSFTPNRYDAASHWGIAREAAAIFRTHHVIREPKLKHTKKKEEAITVHVKNFSLCPRYSARVFDIPKKVCSSPKWMQKILRECGMRPINAVVDIMNYVMLEVGQPLHAFDYAKIAGTNKGIPSIIVRTAHSGEKIMTLDGGEHELSQSMLLITDSEWPLAIAGIKGGKRAESTTKTNRIIVEAASFDYVSIRKTSLFLHLSTDASVRFSHNLSSMLVEYGMNRAHELLEEILDARLVDTVDVYKKIPGRKVISFDIVRFNKLIGIELKRKDIVSCLNMLDFRIVASSDQKKKKYDSNVFWVEVPSYRTDIEIFEDLTEEVIRIYGYDKIVSNPPFIGVRSPEVEPRVSIADQLRIISIAAGFDEMLTHSFLSDKKQYDLCDNIEKRAIELENPIAQDKRYLRTSIVPGLIDVCQKNNRLYDTIRIFEIGNVFAHDKEDLRIGFAIETIHEGAFLEIKGIVEDVLERLGMTDFSFSTIDDMTLSIIVDDVLIGHIQWMSKERAVAEFSIQKIVPCVTEERAYMPIPRYPAVIRDVSFLVDGDVRVSDVLNTIQSVSQEYVEDVDMLDYFEDASLGNGKKSLTFRIVFRADERTLTDGEVDVLLQDIQKQVVETCFAEIR
ncbi:MAG: phenylalanine--tRNA ligase subunit beta [bacterium]